MAINTNQNSNTQLNGILASTPSIPSTPKPPGMLVTGGFSLDEFISPPSPFAQPASSGASGTSGAGAIVVGGGTTPANGAQPAAPALPTAPATPAAPTGANATATSIVPTTTAPVATTAATTTTTTTTTTTPGGGATFETYGFGRAERNLPITVDSGGASFVMPSFNESAKSNTAPPVSWGPGWTKVEKDGMWFMEHSNGMKAIPAVEYRVTPNPAEKVSTVKVANGWGKKFPDGTILVFDRKEGPYRLDPQGNKHKVELGTHTFGGVKVRVFEATVVRTLDKDGNVNVFDSRGNKSAGSKRGRLAAALGAANAGASISGGGKGGGATTDSGPSTASGPGGKGTLVGGGTAVTTEQMTKDVQRLTELARTLTGEIRSGNVDPARLADLQAQLNALPSGILQAAGAAGTMTSDGRTLRHAGETHPATPASTTPAATSGAASPSSSNGTPPAPPVPGSSGSTAGQTVGNGAASGGGANAPVAGVDANATTKQLAAGAKAKLEVAPPAELSGKQARFAQLPDAVQAAVAKAFGSDQGAAALKADQLVAFTSNGEVTLVEGGTVFTKHQAQVRGAGPGEEIAMTVRPGRQPGSVGAMNVNIGRPQVAGGGGVAGASTTKKPARPAATTRPTVPAVPTVAPINASSTTKASRISLFPVGSETRDVAFGGLNGSYTWKNLPAKAKQAILAQLADGSTAAGKAYASRTGSGWSIDPRAIIVLDAGYASFASGLNLVRTATTGAASTRPQVTPPVAGGGPSSGTLGHDATRPPTGGGGVNPVAPSTPPPVAAPSGGGHAHAGGSVHSH